MKRNKRKTRQQILKEIADLDLQIACLRKQRSEIDEDIRGKRMDFQIESEMFLTGINALKLRHAALMEKMQIWESPTRTFKSALSLRKALNEQIDEYKLSARRLGRIVESVLINPKTLKKLGFDPDAPACIKNVRDGAYPVPIVPCDAVAKDKAIVVANSIRWFSDGNVR